MSGGGRVGNNKRGKKKRKRKETVIDYVIGDKEA